jgi:hypothetical protein
MLTGLIVLLRKLHRPPPREEKDHDSGDQFNK